MTTSTKTDLTEEMAAVTFDDVHRFYVLKAACGATVDDLSIAIEANVHATIMSFIAMLAPEHRANALSALMTNLGNGFSRCSVMRGDA
ncbi:hypothetical protein LG047_12740 [Methylocystis sp. WRRC1]|uniref:hypothetical protein n=1 Tax=unclassified Methylocystis TaxID=2625913 RepID=UPI0001F86845|nr:MULTISPECIES: hypothetical protein [unclassified Methylocystis]MCC3246177.1 hypothetical protein [Methylocystis sp. WRRC1]